MKNKVIIGDSIGLPNGYAASTRTANIALALKGDAGQILTMTGNQKKQRATALICMFVVIALMPFFISLGGQVVRFCVIKGFIGSKSKGDVR